MIHDPWFLGAISMYMIFKIPKHRRKIFRIKSNEIEKVFWRFYFCTKIRDTDVRVLKILYSFSFKECWSNLISRDKVLDGAIKKVPIQLNIFNQWDAGLQRVPFFPAASFYSVIKLQPLYKVCRNVLHVCNFKTPCIG